MSRSICVGVMVTGLALAGAADAVAQLDGTAKARRDYGRGLSGGQQAGGQSFARPAYRPTYSPAPAVESYRSFSYEPVAIDAGDKVVVRQDAARLMLGKEQVGALPREHEFTVTEVKNGWLGAAMQKDGERILGWVWHRDVATPAGAAPEPTYRRFSYEPAEATGSPVQTMRPTFQATGPRIGPNRPAQRPSPPEVRLRPGTRRY